jgi:hypothetical protein
MTYKNINRAGVDRAQPLEFAAPPQRGAQPEKPTTIRITVAPDGLRISAEYVGALSSIPAAVEQLRASGILDLVQPLPIAAPRAKKKTRIEPMYQPDGTPCCPAHLRPLKEGQHGLYCSAKAKPGEEQNDKGYCNLKFD